jgi:hypothetical protein
MTFELQSKGIDEPDQKRAKKKKNFPRPMGKFNDYFFNG